MYPGSFNPGLEVYNPRVRPNQGQQGPVEVVVNMYLRAVEDVDAEKNVSRKGNYPLKGSVSKDKNRLLQ